jgi:F1F0 ATPase subunit 2
MQFVRTKKMTMVDGLILCLAAVAGLSLGGIFFGGLWWTIRNGMTAKQPGLWFLSSLIVRMAIVMAGFYFAGGGQWQRLLSCLIGFIAARSIVVRLVRPPHPVARPRSAGGEAAGRSAYSLPSIRMNEFEGREQPTVSLPKEPQHAT